MNIYIPLATAGTVYISNSYPNTKPIHTILQETKPTIFMGNLDIWNDIMKISKNYIYSNNVMNQLLLNRYILRNIGLECSKYCISYGSPVPQETIYFFKSFGIELCNMYWMSETTGPISMGIPGCSRGAGMPIMDIKIDSNTNEILVKGSTIFNGYHNSKKHNVLNDKGWLYTGDTGYIDRDGSLFITGPIKKE
jgi:long-subunit acyl-CoA synthetase (AMP-forming)